MPTELSTNLGKVYYNDNTQPMALGAFSSNNVYLQPYNSYDTDIAMINDLKRYKEMSSKLYEEPKPKKEKKKMSNTNKRGLYQVVLVDPKNSKIIMNEMVISSKVEDVLLEVNAGEKIRTAGLQVGDVDKIINFIGPIRNTRKNKDGVVEVVEELASNAD